MFQGTRIKIDFLDQDKDPQHLVLWSSTGAGLLPGVDRHQQYEAFSKLLEGMGMTMVGMQMIEMMTCDYLPTKKPAVVRLVPAMARGKLRRIG